MRTQTEELTQPEKSEAAPWGRQTTAMVVGLSTATPAEMTRSIKTSDSFLSISPRYAILFPLRIGSGKGTWLNFGLGGMRASLPEAAGKGFLDSQNET